MTSLPQVLRTARAHRASDVHIVAGLAPAFRVDGEIIMAQSDALSQEETRTMVTSLLNDHQKAQLEKELELCFSFMDGELGRFRVNVYMRAGGPELAIRACATEIPLAEDLLLPPIVDEWARKPNGLLLISGPTGVGKTTTMNYMIDVINRERRCKIITIEDPIEFVHRHKRAIIVQQEVHSDTLSFSRALIHVLRQDPDVIAVGEMRDLETISTALTAAETGHLVLATLHTPSAFQTIERILSAFPGAEQAQVTVQLSTCLQGVIAQQLVPRADGGGRVLATEVLVATQAVRRMVRDRDTHQMIGVMETGSQNGMHTMDQELLELYQKGIITYDAALSRARDPNSIKKQYQQE